MKYKNQSHEKEYKKYCNFGTGSYKIDRKNISINKQLKRR